jgi:hypothetical protein
MQSFAVLQRVIHIVTTGFKRLNYIHATTTPKLGGEASIEHLEAPPNVFHIYIYIYIYR